MWSLKVLTGQQTGQTFKLSEGDNQIGRSPEGHIVLSSAGISKRHAILKVNGNAVAIKDLGSSNGTFLNGLKIDQSILQVGDKIAFHNIICEMQFVISQFQDNVSPNFQQQNFAGNMDGNLAQDMNAEEFQQPVADYGEDVAPQMKDNSPSSPKNLAESFHHYIENVMLPGVYKLAKMFELKMVLFCFVLAFIITTTALSTIPMLSITKDTIQKESGRRALGIARSLVRVNSEILSKGFRSQLTTRFAEKEEGVEVALIISAIDGAVIAPASDSGSYKNVEFIHRARKMDEEYFGRVNSKIIGASVPIRTYDNRTGAYDISAYAVVLYNMGNLAIDDGRTISLFIQTLLMALSLGSILFFFMYKLIERPFSHLNKELDGAIKGDTHSIEPEFQFPILKPLYTNINSLVSQSLSDKDTGDSYGYTDPMEKQSEAKNLTSIISVPALAFTSEGNFLAINSAAEEFLSETEGNLINQHIDNLYDESLKLSLQDLLQRCVQESHMIQSNQLEFGGVPMEIDAQAMGPSGNMDYIIICINQKEGEY